MNVTSLWEMSAAGAVLILSTILIRSLAAKRLPRETFLALRGLALARLLIPVAVPSPLSIQNLAVAPTEAAGTLPALPSVPLAPSGGARPAASVVSQAIPWTVVWVAGMAVCALCFAVVYIRCRREFAASLPVTEPPADRFLTEHPLRRRVSIRQSDQIGSPLTYGIFHPVILLPKSTDWSDERAMECVLTHELIHIRRLDAIWKLLLTAAVCLHWFTPLVWAMYLLGNRDLELSCDRQVLRRLGPDARRTYALAFITFEEHRSRPMPFCSGFGSDITEERILSIMKYKKASLLSLVLALLVVAGAASLFATSAQAKGAPGAAAPQAQPTVPAVDRPAAPPFGTADSPQIYQSQDGCGTYVCDVVHTPGVCQTCGETHHSAHEAHHRETHSSHHGHHIG